MEMILFIKLLLFLWEKIINCYLDVYNLELNNLLIIDLFLLICDSFNWLKILFFKFCFNKLM